MGQTATIPRYEDRLSGVNSNKLTWCGTLIGVQPRIRLLRSFSERSHSYLGYSLRLRGTIEEAEGEFLVGIGKAAQEKYSFRVGDTVRGRSEPVADPRLEPVEYYRTARLDLLQQGGLKAVAESLIRIQEEKARARQRE